MTVTKDGLIEHLIAEKTLKTPEVIRAFESVRRSDFVLDEYSSDADLNEPLPIGYGQTISQPFTVAFMLELLKPQSGDKVLDVGAGSGWTAALLRHIVGPTGKVYAVERIPQLKSLAGENLSKAKIMDVELSSGDGSLGIPKAAPFDCIHVAAAAPEIPDVLRQQLAVGGRMVLPVGQYVQEIVLIERVGEREYREERYPGFQFVPLVVS